MTTVARIVDKITAQAVAISAIEANVIVMVTPFKHGSRFGLYRVRVPAAHAYLLPLEVTK